MDDAPRPHPAGGRRPLRRRSLRPPPLARLPIRVRVALSFAVVMAVLLVVASLVLYLRLGSTLRSGIDDGLRTRSDDVVALVRDTSAAADGGSPLTERGETLAQVLSPGGRVLDAPPTFRRTALLSREQLRRARRGTIVVDRPRPRPGDDDAADRVLARPVRVAGRDVIVVVGASLQPVESAQHRLAGLLLGGGPIVLLLASIAGYGAATAALRPMERMRRDAAAIRTGRSGLRVEVPPAPDEVARLAVTLNAMLDRLDDAFARERSFVDDASHELRGPLALIKGELELALRDGDSVPELRAAVASAAEENDRLVRLAEDLLVLARADDGSAPAEREAVAVPDLVEHARLRVAAREGTVEATPQTAAAVLHGDRRRLERAVGNLVQNALQAGASHVEVDVREVGGRVELHVLDDGPGFPGEFLPHAFERFSRADEARARGGTGLGLAIVASVVEGHGGTVGAANRPAGGADVWFALPAPAPEPV